MVSTRAAAQAGSALASWAGSKSRWLWWVPGPEPVLHVDRSHHTVPLHHSNESSPRPCKSLELSGLSSLADKGSEKLGNLPEVTQPTG